MKSAEELFDRYKRKVSFEIVGVQGMSIDMINSFLFEEALTEYKKEIISLIDEMIRINDLETLYGSEYNVDWRIGKTAALTELRNKLGD